MLVGCVCRREILWPTLHSQLSRRVLSTFQTDALFPRLFCLLLCLLPLPGHTCNFTPRLLKECKLILRVT